MIYRLWNSVVTRRLSREVEVGLLLQWSLRYIVWIRIHTQYHDTLIDRNIFCWNTYLYKQLSICLHISMNKLVNLRCKLFLARFSEVKFFYVITSDLRKNYNNLFRISRLMQKISLPRKILLDCIIKRLRGEAKELMFKIVRWWFAGQLYEIYKTGNPRYVLSFCGRRDFKTAVSSILRILIK